MGNILKPTWKLQDKSPTRRERSESISEAPFTTVGISGSRIKNVQTI